MEYVKFTKGRELAGNGPTRWWQWTDYLQAVGLGPTRWGWLTDLMRVVSPLLMRAVNPLLMRSVNPLDEGGWPTRWGWWAHSMRVVYSLDVDGETTRRGWWTDLMRVMGPLPTGQLDLHFFVIIIHRPWKKWDIRLREKFCLPQRQATCWLDTVPSIGIFQDKLQNRVLHVKSSTNNNFGWTNTFNG